MIKTATTDKRYIPDWLKEQDIWAVWTPEFGKTIMAPWETEHCYPASWGEGVEPRPETDFETAKMVADLPPETVHDSWPFPQTDDAPTIPDSLLPTIILPHDPPDPPLMLVDLDDVRDPETGELCPQARNIVDRLDAYTEVSQSGTGLHVFVRAALPGDRGKFIEPLAPTIDIGDLTTLTVSPDGGHVGIEATLPESYPTYADGYQPGHALAGDIELYDHGRVVGATWDHVDGTPYDIPERQAVIDALVDEYDRDQGDSHDAVQPPEPSRTDTASSPSHDTSGDRSPYYDLGIRAVADTGPFRRYRTEAPGGDWSGPHPGHGPQHSDYDECTNFGADTGGETWYCFAHESGGKPLHLAAVLCPHTDVSCRDVPNKAASTNWLQNNPIEMLRTCLWVREEHALDGADPPYAALQGVAKLINLNTDSADVLGRAAYKTARSIYSDLSPGDVS